MMAGIDAIVSLIASFLPLSAIFLMFLIPLTSTLVALYCKGRYLPIYLIAAFGTCMALSAWNFQNTIFYVLPGLFTGISYGLLYKKGIPSSLNIFITSLIQFAFFYLSLWLVKWIYGVDMPSFLLRLIGQGNNGYALDIFPLFGFAYCLATVCLSHIFAISPLSKLRVYQKEMESLDYLMPALGIFFSASAFGFVFLSPLVGYLLLGMAIYWAAWSVTLFIDYHHPASFIVLAILMVISIFMFALLYSKMDGNKGLILVSFIPFSVSISAIFNKCLSNKKGRSLK